MTVIIYYFFSRKKSNLIFCDRHMHERKNQLQAHAQAQGY
jgi:hypothetical protein